MKKNCEMIYVIVLVTLLSEALSAVVPQPEFEITDNYIGVPTIEGYKPANNSRVQTRIRGGKPAKPGQISYQVGLYIQKNLGDRIGSWCGGTLISNQYILTAAHCITKENKIADNVIVFLGATNRKNDREEGQRRISVSKKHIIKHYNYNNPENANDIALIQLPTPVQFNEFIQTANLPSRTQSEINLVGKTIISSGWGHMEGPIISQSPSILQYMQTTVINGYVCSNAFGRENYNDNRQICINAPGKSTCQGDSGGPHILKTERENIVIGVTSYGYITCDAGHPQVLTRVGAYLNWISQHTGIPIKN